MWEGGGSGGEAGRVGEVDVRGGGIGERNLIGLVV